jgi:hypothetical protein
VASPGACAAWVAEIGGQVVGHVALQRHAFPEVTGVARQATRTTDGALAVVARLLVSYCPPPRRRPCAPHRCGQRGDSTGVATQSMWGPATSRRLSSTRQLGGFVWGRQPCVFPTARPWTSSSISDPSRTPRERDGPRQLTAARAETALTTRTVRRSRSTPAWARGLGGVVTYWGSEGVAGSISRPCMKPSGTGWLDRSL